MKTSGLDETELTWSAPMADSTMERYPLLARRWHYEPGVVLLAIRELWLKTGEDKYYDYVKRNIDEFVDADGDIRTYRLGEYNLDQINEGKLLFVLYDTSGDERYKKAIYLLRKQLQTQPRTGEGGFWHKQIYPHQMWLDGIYMASPFYAEFGSKFGEPAAFDDVIHQILLIEKHTRDSKTGLLHHGWDESREQKWADPATGCSASFWGRAMGWYAMAIPDVLDHLPEAHPQRDRLVKVLETTVAAAVGVQDPATGVWYQVLDQGNRQGNYLEASASCTFVYAMAKGIRKGYLDHAYLGAARRGYDGILEQFISSDDAGLVNLGGICSVGGLGGEPYRDGSFEYYIREPVVSNEHKGVGAFILASVEMERLEQL